MLILASVSPSLYVTFYSITVYDHCVHRDDTTATRGGTTYPNHLMALDAVSTFVDYSYTNETLTYIYSKIVDFAAWASDYETSLSSCLSSQHLRWYSMVDEGAIEYLGSEYITTYVTDYCVKSQGPEIIIPVNLGADLDPKWSTCNHWPYGIPDPPRALVPAGTMNPATTLGAGLAGYTAPSPGSSPERQEATPTTNVASPMITSRPAFQQIGHMPKQSLERTPDESNIPKSAEDTFEPNSGLSAEQATNPRPKETQEANVPAEAGPLPVSLSGASIRLSPSQAYAEHISFISLGGAVLTPIPGPSRLMILSDQTLTPGAAVTVVAGDTISYDKSSIFVNGEGAPLPTVAAPPPAPPHRDGTYSVAFANAKDFSSVILAPNSATNSLFVVTDGNGQKLPGVVFGTSIVGVAGSFLTPGAPPVIVNNARVSVDPSMSHVVVNGIPHALPQPSVPTAAINSIAAAFSSFLRRPAPHGVGLPSKVGSGNINARPLGKPNHVLPFGVNTIAGHAITAAPSGAIALNDLTLKPGDPAVTINGAIFSLDTTGSLVLDGKSYPLSGLAMAGSNAQQIATVAGHVISMTASGAVVIGGQTLRPGGPAVKVNGAIFFLDATGSLILDGKAYSLPNSAMTGSNAQHIATVGGQVLSIAASGTVVFSGQTLKPGDPPVMISGTRVWLGTAGLIVGTSTVPLPSSSANQIAGIDMATDGAGNIVISGKTLHPGDPAIWVSGLQISFGNNGVIVGTSTMPLSAIPTRVGNLKFTSDNVGNVIIGETTLHRGDQAMTVSGTRISLGDGGLVIGTQTIALFSLPAQTAGPQFSTDGAGNVIINGLTLHPGDAALTISGTRVSLGVDGVLTAGSRTFPVSSLPTRVAGMQIATDGNGNIIINGVTLHPGDAALTISGTRISLGVNGVLTAGSQTLPVSSLPTSIADLRIVTDGNGNIIFSNGLVIHPGDAVTVSGTQISLGVDGFVTAGTLTTPVFAFSTEIADLTITTDGAGNVFIAGKMVHPGDPAITISGTPVSLGTTGILTAGSKTIPIGGTKVFTVGGLVFTSIPGGVVISGTTLLNGAPARTANGKLVSVGANGVVSVGGSVSKVIITTKGIPAAKETTSASLRRIPGDGGVDPTATSTKEDGAAALSVPTWGGLVAMLALWGFLALLLG